MAQQGNINVNGLSISVWDMQSTAQQIDDTVNAVMEWQEDPNNPGCYYHMVDGVQEWLNPPLLIGIEYRTIERYNGKPVYEKLVDFGALPNTSYKFVLVDSNAQVIRASGKTSDERTLPGVVGVAQTGIINCAGVGAQVQIVTYADQSSLTAIVCAWYTKTID